MRKVTDQQRLHALFKEIQGASADRWERKILTPPSLPACHTSLSLALDFFLSHLQIFSPFHLYSPPPSFSTHPLKTISQLLPLLSDLYL